MKFRHLTFAIFLIAILLMSCSREQAIPEDQPEFERSYDYILSRYIRSHVSGNVKPDDPIRVRFTSNMTEPDMVGKEEEKIKFSFSPSLKGKAIWEDRQTIVYIPSKPLPMRKEFAVKVNIEDLIDEEVKIEPLEFKFTVLGREINFYRANLVKFEDSRDILTYKGQVGFNLALDQEMLKSAVKLFLEERKLDLNWDVSDPAKNRYTFESEPLQREESQEAMKIIFDAKTLQLSEDYQKDFNLGSLHEMAVVLLKKLIDEENPGIEIEFSDDLDPSLDLNGYIFLEPELDFKLQVMKNKVILTTDFEFGKSYQVTIKKGIRNIYNEKLAEDQQKVIAFADQKPQIIFVHEGVFNPSSNKSKIRFRSLNVKKVNLKISRIFANNLCQFLQDSALESARKQTDFNYYRMNRVGIEVASEDLEIGEVYNSWLENEIDLSKLLEADDKGIYVVSLSFTKDDILYRAPQASSNYNNYYTDPRNWGYYSNNGNIYKPVVVSDIGLTCKQGADKVIVFANNVLNTDPISNCKIYLKSYQNQVLAEGRTNNSGICELEIPNGKVFYIEAEHRGQRSLIKLNEMKWNYSTFNVEGVSGEKTGINSFIYTERGVYRPGDDINISILLRNDKGTFPDNHPIEIEIKNPRRQKILQKTLKKSVDGFYHLLFQTKPQDPTGEWLVSLQAGNQTFHHKLKIETVVAERLRIDLVPEAGRITSSIGLFTTDLQANYLFGNPASGLKAEVSVEIFPYTRHWETPDYNNYSFQDETVNYKTQTLSLYEGILDEDGHSQITWDVTPYKHGPSPLMTKWVAEVIETGGRSSKEIIYLPLDPYKFYVGISKMDDRWQKIGKPISYKLLLLDDDGKPAVGKDLRIRIYQNSQYWWWEYDRRDRKYHFKTDTETELCFEENHISQLQPLKLEYTPETWGQYLIEVTHIQDGEEKHISSQFFNASYWGRMDGGMQNAGVIALATDKDTYSPGDDAVITFPAPAEALALVTIEKGDQIIDHSWYKPQDNQGIVRIPITDKMLPNAYCCVSVLQPHKQTANDRPLRMYGIVPLMVEDVSTRQNIELKTPEKIAPNSNFKVEIQTVDHKQTQFTIAIVDEGLLSLTDYITPDPWKNFYQKIRLAVESFDNFSYILGAIKGDVFKTYSVGGDFYAEYQAKPKQPEEVKRFKAISMFQGPLQTDEKGYAQLEFLMPEYIGAVRIMVATANKNRYGKAGKTVPVKSKLMLLPTLPRMLAPKDKFIIPIEIYRTDKDLNEVEIEITTEDLISIKGSRFKTVVFEDQDRLRVNFEAEVKNQVGETSINISAKSGEIRTQNITEIAVRPYSTRIFKSDRRIINPGETDSFTIPAKGLSGTNEINIKIFRKPLPNLETRMGWLLRYPYGCIEQSTSATFPQLMLKQILIGDFLAHEEIDKNINTLIKRIRKFQHPSGGFTYWPGSGRISDWGSLYAGHFLVEAENLGYHVPQDLYKQWLKYEQSMIKKNYNYTKENYYNVASQVYRAYILALARAPETSVMNYLKEDILSLMNDTQRWILAASYKLIGMDGAAESIMRTAGVIIDDYNELGGTFGSVYRDKAMILMAMDILEQEELALSMYEDICHRLSDSDWLSTQALGFSLLAAGKYIKSHEEDFLSKDPISGKLIFPDGSQNEFYFSEFSKKFEIPENYINQEVQIEISSETNLASLFANLQWSGIPLHPENKDYANGIGLEIEWEDEQGNPLDPTKIEQGSTFYQRIRVENKLDRKLENLALTQILPSGWELESERYIENQYQNNNDNDRDYLKAEIDYTDIRDDRIIYFFELSNRKHYTEVKFKLRAVTSGTFQLPPTVCETMYDHQYRCIKKGRQVKVN